jgi:hypothetical protein
MSTGGFELEDFSSESSSLSEIKATDVAASHFRQNSPRKKVTR